MIKEKECREAFNVLQEQHDYLSSNMHYNYPFSIEMLERVQYCFEELITEHFELVSLLDKWEISNLSIKELDEWYVRGQWHVKRCDELGRELDKLKDKYSKILDDVHDYRYETHRMKLTIRNLCKYFGVESEKDLQNIYLNKPYKFEDLKDGMWVYNKKNKNVIQCYPHITNHNVQCVRYESWIDESGDYMESYEEFEEDCFFPVWCANAGI